MRKFLKMIVILPLLCVGAVLFVVSPFQFYDWAGVLGLLVWTWAVACVWLIAITPDENL